MRADWVLASDGTNPEYPFGFSCLRCGAIEKISSPSGEMLVNEYLRRSRAFLKQHKKCKADAPEGE